MRAGLHYVAFNIGASTLFLLALGLLYGLLGTLNMAEMAARVAEVPAGDLALVEAAAGLLLVVFCAKAALLPMYLWLPQTYTQAPAAVAALFAIMTKVGAYSILRLYVLAFGPDAGASSLLAAQWLLPAAMLTLALGMIGVLAARSLSQLASFAVIGSMGTLLIAVGLFTAQATAAALYYMLHSTLAVAALFLIAEPLAGHVVEPLVYGRSTGLSPVERP